jgi:pyruvate ferredoxin oxidoreductase alpha subunit
MAYRIAEDPEVCLPVLVNMDGFYLSFTREPVVLPDEAAVREFLPLFKPSQPVFQASEPMARASAVFGGGNYSYFKIQHHLAAQHVENVFRQVAQEFGERFGRFYGAVEPYRLDDAEYVFVMSNSFATKGKAAVQRLRKNGIQAGLLKLSLLRPFPSQVIADALARRPKVAVIDQNLAPGMGGILYPEILKAVYRREDRPEHLLSVIGGLGGRDIQEGDFVHILERLDQPPGDDPLFLFDEKDLKQFDQLRQIAGFPKEARVP